MKGQEEKDIVQSIGYVVIISSYALPVYRLLSIHCWQ